MKQLLTLCLALISVTSMAQWPTLPYNPDENGDGLIGVVDLAALLAQYNTEFASAVVSEDGESAIVYMGQMGYFECEYSCNQLPGFWSLPSAADLVPVYPDLHAGGYTTTWLDKRDFDGFAWNYYPYYVGHSTIDNRNVSNDNYPAPTKKCYCAARQLPRVEYCYCEGGGNIEACAQAKVAEGWYPLNGISSHHVLPGATNATYANLGYQHKVQAFWRWAE